MPKKRRYCLSSSGMSALRASARRNQPWSQSTGPRTQKGKARSARNAFKHGERSAETMALHRNLMDSLRMLKDYEERPDEVRVLAQELEVMTGIAISF